MRIPLNGALHNIWIEARSRRTDLSYDSMQEKQSLSKVISIPTPSCSLLSRSCAWFSKESRLISALGFNVFSGEGDTKDRLDFAWDKTRKFTESTMETHHTLATSAALSSPLRVQIASKFPRAPVGVFSASPRISYLIVCRPAQLSRFVSVALRNSNDELVYPDFETIFFSDEKQLPRGDHARPPTIGGPFRR